MNNKTDTRSVRTRCAERHVAQFPSGVRRHGVAPDSFMPVRRIAAEVVRQLGAAVGELRILVIVVFVRSLRRPMLTHLAAHSCTHQAAVVETLNVRLTRCRKHTRPTWQVYAPCDTCALQVM